MKERILRAMKADAIPAAESGLWMVKKFSLAKPFFVQRQQGGRGVTLPAGRFTQLWRVTEATLHLGGELVMCDTPDELNTHLDFILNAYGRVLVTGLGLGCVARGLLANPAVKHVVVVERDFSVLKLVAPYIPTQRITIVCADAIEFVKKPRNFDCAWHDLWTDESGGEPHLQVQHMELLCAMSGQVTMQGAWAFPRYYRRLMKTEANVI